MKNIRFLYKFLFGVVASLVISSCSVDDGPIKKEYLDLIEAVPAISTKVDVSGNQAIDVLNPGSFQGKFTVTEYFDGPGSFSPEKVDVVVRKNGGTGSNVKVFKADVSSFPASFTVSTAELQALFGAPVVLNDNYDFSADVYVNGKKFEAFPLGGVPTSAGPTAAPGYSHFARFGAICAYDPAIFQGEFVVTTDGFGLAVGETVVLSRVDDNKFSFIHPLANDGLPITFTVNTANNTVSMARTKAAASWKFNASYPNGFVATSGTSSIVAPCDGIVTLLLTYTVDAGSFGDRALALKKK